MQVKKFEAKTIKEALQMIKQELGPDAIILSAKDHKKSFGLAGRGSIEVTAAISERSLQKKTYAESRLPSGAKEKFKSKSAKHQKAFIENTMEKYRQRNEPDIASRSEFQTEEMETPKQRPPTGRRYIDIVDDEQNPVKTAVSGRRVDDVLEEFEKKRGYLLEDAANGAIPEMARTTATAEVLSLRQEVETLRDLLNRLQQSELKNPVTRHPGAEYGLSFELSGSFEKLQTAGIDVRYIVEILEKAEKELTGIEKKKRSLVDAWVARYIMSHTSVAGQWNKDTDGVQLHLFMGPSGHGKTTSLVKIASQMAIQERKKVAIFSTDTLKVGAADQLKIYSQILNIPFETIKHSIEFVPVMKKYMNYDAVLVDFPGMSLREISEIDQMRALMPPREIRRHIHLVIGCNSKDLDAYDICHRYQVTHYDHLIITKIDESFAHGFIYNIQRKTEKPLYAFGIGTKIPEDIELATRERVLDLIYKLSKRNV